MDEPLVDEFVTFGDIRKYLDANPPSEEKLRRIGLLGAIEFNRPERLAEAFAQGADPRELDCNGRCCLMLAANLQSFRCIPMLLGVCDPLARDANGFTALMIAASAPSNLHCVKLLAPHSDLLAVDTKGRRASELADKSGRGAVFEYLVGLEALAFEAVVLREATQRSVDPSAPLASRGPRL